MRPIDLAERLIACEGDAERKTLLAENSALANFALANELKNACYQAWTTESNKVPAIAGAMRTLTEFNGQAEILALSAWTNGIEAIVKSETSAAIDSFDRAAAIFQSVNNPHEAANTQVAKLYALALVGRYDEAVETGQRALAVFIEYKDELAAAKIEKNLGNIFVRRHQYAEARAFLESALRRFLPLENEAQTAMIENSLAIVYALQNDFRRAEKLYQQALERAARAGLIVTQAETEASLGNLALFRGRYAEALQFLEKSRAKYAALEMPHQRATADLEIADVYLELNLLTEARAIYERIAPQFAAFQMGAEEARARANFGKTLARTGEVETALKELEKAGMLYHSEGNSVGAANVKLNEALSVWRANQPDAARALAEAAENALDAAGSPQGVLFARLMRGTAERTLENFAAATEILRGVCQAAEQRELPQIAWAAATGLGLIAEDKGDFALAGKHFNRAVEIIEAMRSPLGGDEFRTAFVADKLAPYQRLADIARQNGNIAEALEWIERARSQALLDLLAENPAGKMSGDARTQARFDELREELNWFYSRLHRSGELETPDGDAQSLQTEIRRLENEINSLVLQTEAGQTGNAAVRRGQFDLARLQNLLGAETVLLEFAEFEGEFAAFVVGEEGVELVENLGAADEIQKLLEDVHFQFGSLRYGAERLAKHLPQLKRRIEHHFQQLYGMLIEPLADLIDGRNLIIVPSGVLHYVPFNALHDGEKYLIETCEISFAPSAAVLQNLLEKSAGKIERVLAVGFADERVPQVEAEVESLSAIFPAAQILTGDAARFETVRESLREGDFDVLHLACHGQFRAENPLFSSLHLADGWATVREAARLNLPNALVVLSACETGLNKIAAGEELLGLVRGFLAAGANALVISLWTVNDAATARLMRDFYRHLQNGASFAAALRNAQLKFIAENAHPYFWSPFVATGER